MASDTDIMDGSFLAANDPEPRERSPAQSRRMTMTAKKADMIEIENAVSPGRVYRVDRAKYEAMRKAYLTAAPDSPPGMTIAEIQKRLLPHLPDELFPGGAKAGWWAKAVQLDLEAKGILARGRGSPVRLWRLDGAAAVR
jgi:hypothetical protein